MEGRTNAVRDLTDTDLWQFVPGDCNPSGIATRKRNFVNLGSNALFWNGPSFLMLDLNLNRVPLNYLITLKMLRQIWLLVKIFQIMTFLLKT